MNAACCKQGIVIHTDTQNCEYVIIYGEECINEEFDAEALALPEEDLQKGKEVGPFLLRLERSSDLKHVDDYSRNRAPRPEIRIQKKRVAKETSHSRKRELGIRLLPVSKEDTKMLAKVKFSSQF